MMGQRLIRPPARRQAVSQIVMRAGKVGLNL